MTKLSPKTIEQPEEAVDDSLTAMLSQGAKELITKPSQLSFYR